MTRLLPAVQAPCARRLASALAWIPLLVLSASGQPGTHFSAEPYVGGARDHRVDNGRALREATELSSSFPLNGALAFNIDFAADGAAWVATSSGLIRYDGFSGTRYTSAHGLPSDFVRAVLVGEDGTVWAGTDKGVARSVGNRFEPFQIGPPGTAPNVRRIRQHPDLSVWICSDSWLKPELPGGLFIVRGAIVASEPIGEFFPSRYVSDVHFGNDGTAILMGLEGFVVGKPGAWQAAPLPDTPSTRVGYAWSGAQSADGARWVATENGVYRLDERGWLKANPPGFPFGFARLAIGPDGQVVTISPGPRRVRLIGSRDGWVAVGGPIAEDRFIEDLVTAPDQSMWFSGENMIVRIPPKPFDWTEFRDLPRPVFASPDGAVWFSDGLRTVRYAHGRFHLRPELSGRLLWGGTSGLVAWGARDITVNAYDEPERVAAAGLGMAVIEQVTLDGDGLTLHAFGRSANGRGVHAIRTDGSWVLDDTFDLAAPTRWETVPIRGKGVWLLVDWRPLEASRLLRLGPKVLESIQGPTGTSFYGVRLFVDPDGEPVVASDFELVRWAGEAWSAFDALPGRHVLWAGAVEGKFVLAHTARLGGAGGISVQTTESWITEPMENLSLVGAHPSRPIFLSGDRLILIDTGSDGLVLELPLPAGMAPEQAFQDASGSIWVHDGVRTVRHERDAGLPKVGVTLSSNLVTQGDTLYARFRGIERFAGEDDATLQVSWRIDTGPWSGFSSVPFVRVSTALLTLDSHAIQVRARGHFGNIQEGATTASFTVRQPPFEDRWYFWPIVLATVLLAFVAIGSAASYATVIGRFNRDLEEAVEHRTRGLERATERVRELSIRLQRVQETERGSLARELHDEVGGLSTTLLMVLRSIRPGAKNLENRIGEATGLTRQLMDTIRYFSFALRPSVLDDFGLEEAIHVLSRRTAELAGIEVQSVVNLDETPPLDRDMQTGTYRIIQECLSNVVRHSKATRVDILVERADRMIRIVATDNGVGFDPERVVAAGSSGLAGIRERAELLAGHVQITSSIGAGSRIEAFLPLESAIVEAT